ncbi:hypothetical protein Daesc_005693 [Daldinia eschscholtzii]|uniref:Uncharacterized protein n=1 Tax=Daldinia eschscholtzii TaxID=292717 RepID=A0AAX6ML48_9PEZI
MAATGGSWRALLLLCLMVFTRAAGAKKTTITPAPSGPTAVPIFLPDVPGTQWSEWRGSIISSNNVGTVYSVFCAPDRIGCSIAGDDLVPFRFTEGPGTLNVADTIAGTVTQACDLTSTTAATCSGSTFVAGALAASLGPLLSNTSVAPYTLTGASAAASWGVLTLGDAPLTRTKGGKTYTYYTTSTATTTTATTAAGSESIPATTTTGQTAIGAGAGAGSASTSTRAAGGGSGSGSGSGGGGSGSGSGSRGGKGHPKKSGASMRVEVQGVLGAGAVLAGLVVVLL